MKLIKKIAAMLFAFAMVFSMGTNVKAEGIGKITIDPANAGETYNVYKILTLQSYNEGKGLYSYVKNGDQWDGFIDSAKAEGYLTINDDGYVEFDAKKTAKDYREFAQKALAYAKEKKIPATQTVTPVAGATTATIDKLDLGYYLVGSTVGALCSLDTTNPEAKIKDKNEKPTVDKKIDLDGTNFAEKNSVNIGDHVSFKTTINVKPGAKNYVLHDRMDSHLEYTSIYHVEDNLDNLRDTTDFVVKTKTDGLTDGCTFEISFTEAYFKKNRENIDTRKLTKITVQYGANVKDDAVINEPMKNTTHLTYGDQNTVTNESETITKTFGIPVFKYTGESTPLEGARFILSTDSTCNDDTKNLKFSLNESGKYRFNTLGTATLKSQSNGYIYIEGLKAGTYYLKETKAPDGYNLLKTIQKIEIGEDGSIKLNDNDAVITGDVKVKNNSGIELPSTGGMGTTLIYLAGIVLVVLSGYVLISKRRASTK